MRLGDLQALDDRCPSGQDLDRPRRTDAQRSLGVLRGPQIAFLVPSGGLGLCPGTHSLTHAWLAQGLWRI